MEIVYCDTNFIFKLENEIERQKGAMNFIFELENEIEASKGSVNFIFKPENEIDKAGGPHATTIKDELARSIKIESR